MKNSYQHIYLSPHYDDASLSCGGAIHKQTQAGESVLVITICAAAPHPTDPLSPFAQELHTRWGNPVDVVATRLAEDETAMALLGVEVVRLEVMDCIYRGRPRAGMWYYNNNAQLFGDVHPGDLALKDDIAAAIAANVTGAENGVIYAPLTVGHHADHQLAHAAAWVLREQGRQVVFYEDYPYADPDYAPHGEPNLYGLEATLARLGQKFQSQLQYFSEENLQAKIESVAAYASQLQLLFGGRAAMAQQVRHYALQVGEGRLAERVWLPEGLSRHSPSG